MHSPRPSPSACFHQTGPAPSGEQTEQPVTLRAITAQDDAVLAEIYASTRRQELAPILDWSVGQKEAFLRQQFAAQHRYYQEAFPAASFDLVLWGAQVVGRLYIDRRARELRVIDIALLPQFRGSGVGTRLLQGVFAEAEQGGASVSIHVERLNPALRWYRRLGFQLVEDKGVYLLMRWTPAGGGEAERRG